METLEESLSLFGQTAADALDELMMVMPAHPGVADDAREAKQVLLVYTELVQRVGQLAGAAGLTGVESLCALAEANLLILQDEGRALKSDEFAALQEWPALLFDYWAGQAESGSCVALLRNMSEGWPLPLSEEVAEEELGRMQRQAAPAAEEIIAAAPSASPVAPPAAAMQEVDREMLSILAREFGQIQEQLNTELSAVAGAAQEEMHAALADYRELLERLGGAVGAAGLSSLGALFSGISQLLAAAYTGLTPAQQSLLCQLPDRVASYLAAPADGEAAAFLLQLLTDPAWPLPVSAAEAALWSEALTNVTVTESTAQAEQRPAYASAEDVSLALPGDVNPELLDGLLQELPVQTGAFTTAIGRIATGNGTTKDMERAMRAAHTLKGAANTVGIRGIAQLTHHVEDILVALIAAERMPGRTLAGVLMNAGDCLEAMSEALLGIGAPPPEAQQVLQEVLDCANQIDHEGAAAEPVPQKSSAVAPRPEPLPEISEPEPPAAPAPVVEQAVRIPASVTDELMRLAGESLISNSQIQERLRLTTRQSAIIRRQNQLIRQLVAELEDLVDIRGVSSTQQMARTEAEFDALEFEHYGELHTVTHRLVEAATDAQEMADDADRQLDVLTDLLEEQRKLQMANQHTVMRTRMVAVSSMVPRLQRSVRQTARLLDKQVLLIVRGEHTNIDSHVLNDLMDPLMHILRNAVDHGIEAPEDRAARGKPAQGSIELVFAREGNSVVVRCSDDGAGLDYAAIRRSAKRKGMIPNNQEHTDEELARLILAPGFSTREEASQVSGRGVGMDVVYSRILEMKGELALRSQTGTGLTIELRLPSTLLSTHTLIVRQREKRLAVSTRGVDDIRYVQRDQIQQIGPRQFFQEGERMFSLLKLEELFALPSDRRSKDRHGFPVLLVRTDSGATCAVLLQEILDSREVVMKNFGRYVPRTQGVIGAVILGDGGVAPVLDLVERLRVSPQQMLSGRIQEILPAAEPQPAQQSLTVLIVDDSLSARRHGEQVMKDAGFSVRTASDGLEAANMLTRFVPDLMLVDMEMPRMSGLELTAHVRGTERTKHVPIIMITSRSTEKHRQMSAAAGVNAHLTKPFNDHDLLQHAIDLTKR